MTWTFAPQTDGWTDVNRVRWEVGDVNSDRQIFQNEIIQAVVSDVGSWQVASIQCIESIIMQITSNPDLTADWLHVSYKTALDSYQRMLTLKARDLGVPVGQITATALYIWRPDSMETSQIVYPGDGPAGGINNNLNDGFNLQ